MMSINTRAPALPLWATRVTTGIVVHAGNQLVRGSRGRLALNGAQLLGSFLLMRSGNPYLRAVGHGGAAGAVTSAITTGMAATWPVRPSAFI